MLSNIALYKDKVLPGHYELCAIVIPHDNAMKEVLSIAIQIFITEAGKKGDLLKVT